MNDSSLDNLDDAACLLAAARGERTAFEAIARRYQQRLMRFAAQSVGRDEAADVVQDALVKAFVNADRYDPRYSAATWLFTLTRRCAIDRLRAQRRTILWTNAAICETPLAAAERRDLHGRLWCIAAERLSADQLQALWLHYVEDLGTREVALVMKRSWAWVKTALHRGRKTLSPHVQHLRDDRAAHHSLEKVIA